MGLGYVKSLCLAKWISNSFRFYVLAFACAFL